MGHRDLAVNNKTFAYLSAKGKPFAISCKLPPSHASALLFPFARPSPYGLGKSGWVTAQFEADDNPPLDLFLAWLDESHRAQAPKKWVTKLAINAPRAKASRPKAKSARKP